MKRQSVYLAAALSFIVMVMILSGCGTSAEKSSANGGSYSPVISGNGRYVAFASYDPALRKDVNAECAEQLCWQIYVRDMETGKLAAASEPAPPPNAAGVDAYNLPYGRTISYPNEESPTSIAISDDGRFVVFASSALNPGDKEQILYRKDMQSGELSPVSTIPSAPQDKATFFFPSMSGDGRFIAYWTFATRDLYVPAGSPKGAQLYIRDMTAAAPEAVSVDVLPGGVNVEPPTSKAVDISDDGRFIAFAASSIRADLPLVQVGVYIKDRQTGSIRTISSNSAGESANSSASVASITDDGRLAVFAADSTNLAPEPTCKQNLEYSETCTNVYLIDLGTGETRLLSKTESGAAMDNAGSPVISKDGSSVAFVTFRAATPAGKTEPTTYPLASRETIYLCDLRSGQTVAVTPQTDGSETGPAPGSEVGSVPSNGRNGPAQVLQIGGGPAGAQGMGISADGRYIVFPSLSGWQGMEDRMCAAQFTNELGQPDSGSEPCKEVFYKDVITGNLSRVSAPSQ